jgi:hypothetical protein
MGMQPHQLAIVLGHHPIYDSRLSPFSQETRLMRTADFRQPPALPWRLTQLGDGRVRHTPGALHLTLPPVEANQYHDAQITDYAGKSDFAWRPPLRLMVRARFSTTDLRGTAGFGFWNHPFVPGERGFRLPAAAWFFFSSSPSNLQLALDVPGPGWKAATLNARRWQFLALAPTAPLGFLLMRIPAFYRRLWPLGQRAIGVSECLLDPALLTTSHTYTLDWQRDYIRFAVDNAAIHQTPTAPHGPLGFIAWLDNQYAIVTPQGRFGFGLVAIEREQSFILENITVERLI